MEEMQERKEKQKKITLCLCFFCVFVCLSFWMMKKSFSCVFLLCVFSIVFILIQ